MCWGAKTPAPSQSGAGSCPPGTTAPCPCANLELTARIIEIKGLHKPGVDDRPTRPSGTTKNSGYEAGYTSGDDKGRIFTNRALDGAWRKDQQYIELTVELDVAPSSCPIPADTKIKWTIEDPDDPTNEPANVHADAGRLIDPNDYSGITKSGANNNDNNPRGKATATARLEEVDPLYALSGDETLVDPATRRSKVRFHVSDNAGDNYRIKAEGAHPSASVSNAAQTGVMTVWDRVEIEYVKMNSANELPVDQIARHYDMACVQVDVSERRVVTGPSDMAAMGSNDGLAFAACEDYCTSVSGEFTHEGQGGWFFMVAANRFVPARTATILYEGNAEARGDRVRLPIGTTLAGAPKVVRVFNAARIAGMSPPKPNDFGIHIKFSVSARSGRDVIINPHDFHEVDDPDNSFLDANLSHYGFPAGATIPIQVLGAGDDALVTAGISPGGASVGGKHYFGGRLMVFTQNLTGSSVLVTLCHELCHAFDNAHKCGNWDWESKAGRTSCCMNYWFQFVLNDASPRAPIAWTQNKQSANMCGPHIISIRDYHLEDNPGLGW
ncbi:hypothetical protein [Luteimonas salinilitoris]|uniref:Lysine-specific metallo-endopeptidase domain-containing protein n=1 Tax=Luteimonas salinilitoris TaxID=3237697 RepID=A0ABV4HRU7_9GAMM